MSIRFDTALKGKDRTTGDSAIYYIDNIQLQQIKAPGKVSGWTPTEDAIIYSTTGYTTNSQKTALVHSLLCNQQTVFQLINSATKEVTYEGALQRKQTTIGEFGVIDFTAFNQPGTYQLKVGKILTPTFRIDEKLWDNSLWRVLNFLFCQRCGLSLIHISLSRLLTLRLYYDRQQNTPLISSSSYPVVSADFGFSMKFSLTRDVYKRQLSNLCTFNDLSL